MNKSLHTGILAPIDNLAGKYYTGLDGLRGIAMLLVLGYHNYSFLSIFDNAWLALDMFFVLSGFLITDILLRTKETKDQLRVFYIRRVLRIFPIYYISLVLFLLVLPDLSLGSDTESYYDRYITWFWVYCQNWLFIFKTPDPSTILNHYWSLAVEEQFYLIWPFLVLLIKNTRRLMYVLLGVLLLVTLTRMSLFFFPISKLNYYNFHTFTRIDGLLTGSILAIYLSNHQFISRRLIFRILLVLLIANVLFLTATQTLDPLLPYFPFVGYCTCAIVFSLLVYLIISKENKLRFFKFPFFRFIGKISYGLYLYHWPVYLLGYPVMKKFFEDAWNMSSVSSRFTASTCATFLAILIGYLSFRFIETNFLRLKKYASYRKEPKPALTAEVPL